jgi:hypothetical protein
MLAKIQKIITEELKSAENRIWVRLEGLMEKGDNEFEGTFGDTANLFIPYLDDKIISFAHQSDTDNR